MIIPIFTKICLVISNTQNSIFSYNICDAKDILIWGHFPKSISLKICSLESETTTRWCHYRSIFHCSVNRDGRAILTAICPNIKHIRTQSVLSAQRVGTGRTLYYNGTKRRLRVKLKCRNCIRYRYIGRRVLRARYIHECFVNIAKTLHYDKNK